MSGQLTDPRSRFLGTRSPKLFPTAVRGHRSMLALSSRPWLGYSDQGRFTLSPLSYETLDYAAGEERCTCCWCSGDWVLACGARAARLCGTRAAAVRLLCAGWEHGWAG